MKKILLILLSFAFYSAQAQEKQNAIFIILDDMNDYIGVMGGHPQAITPNIDKLAEEGVFFANAHSNAPICAPSRASFLSGLYPSTTGNFGFTHLDENQTLMNSKFLMEYVLENGFEPYSTGKIFHRSVDDVTKNKGQSPDQGPHAWDGVNPIPHPSVPEPFRNVGLLNGSFAPLSDVPPLGWRNNYNANTAFKYVSPTNRDKMADELSADFVCEWIDKHETLKQNGNETPFFIFYGGMKPHTPHTVPQLFFDKFPLDKVMIPEILKNDLQDAYQEHYNSSGFNDYDSLLVSYATAEEGLKRYVQSKLAAIAFADSLVGVIIDKLNNSSFADNTIVILTGDNGFHMGEKFRLAKNTLWEESTRVPLIVKAPGFETSKGAVVNHPVGLIDIYPTFKDLLKLTGNTKKTELGADLDGFSLRAFLENPETENWEGPNYALESVINPIKSEISLQNYAVRSKNYRYIHYPSGKEEFYDHSKDKNEWTNLIYNSSYESIIQEHRVELKKFIPDISFETVTTYPYLFYDNFESYEPGTDLLTKGYQQKNEGVTTTVVSENGNQFARNISETGSAISFRRNIKNLIPGKLYFFEASTRTEISAGAGSWEALEPKSISGHECTDWKSFSIPLITDINSWSEGLSMNVWITSAQNRPLDVDSFRFYAADIFFEETKKFHVNELIAGIDYQFSVRAIPESQTFSWSVNNLTGEASVDENGKLTTVSEGKVELIATMDNYPMVNCTTEVFIWENAVNPVLTINEVDENLKAGVPYLLSANLTPEINTAILWSVDDETKANINQTTGFILPKAAGTITVTAKLYGNDEVFDTKQITIDAATSINNIKSSDFQVYPNPSSGIFRIDGDGAVPYYKIYNMNGKLIKSEVSEIINLSGYAKGVYFLVIDKHNIEKLIIK